mmetsp:Transcript_36823/g.66210  ORF Transcript_36823/g.66210 Transcript_36823/m.66210 type:complete len:303 (-) Transcript_36823:195-1103(-)
MMSPIIPGLVKEAYTPGSRHSVGTPELIKSNVKCDEVDFAWKAVGSSIYSVTAKGSLVITAWDNRGPKYDGNKFIVLCSCPDGVRQNEQNTTSIDTLYVCKHAKAALDSVCDPEAKKVIGEKKEVMVQKQKELQAERVKYRIAQSVEQDERLPGERERILYGLSKRSDAEIAKLVKDSTTTVEGLEALGKLFPTSVMPPKKSVRCGRCEKEYDPQLKSDLICREEHPYDRVKKCWDTSKKSWDHCRRCGKTFNLDGYHSWGKRRRDDPEDEGEFCYETTHVPNDEYDEDGDHIIDGLDNSDY